MADGPSSASSCSPQPTSASADEVRKKTCIRCVIDFFANRYPAEDYKVCFRCLHPSRLPAVVMSLLFYAFAMVTYGKMANIGNYKYIEWAKDNVGRQGRLPDAILDSFIMPNEINWLSYVADIGTMSMIVAAGVFNVFTDQGLYWNLQFALISVSFLVNIIAENVTIIPSVYGLQRCLDLYHYASPADNKIESGLQVSSSCVAMIWSGHTINVGISGPLLLAGLTTYFPCLARPICCLRFLTPRVIIFSVFLLTIILAMLLNYAHYTVDIVLSLILLFLVWSNDWFLHKCYKLNWLAARIYPFSGNLYWQLEQKLFVSASDEPSNEEAHKGAVLEGITIDGVEDAGEKNTAVF